MMKNRFVFRSILLIVVGVICLWYFLSPNDYHERVSVGFMLNKSPYVSIEIEGKSYPVLIDLGARSQMSLEKDILEQIQKKPEGTHLFRDMHGKRYESVKYRIPKIKIGSVEFKDIEVLEENIDFVTKGSVLYSKDTEKYKREVVGDIGRGLLKQVNMLLDFPHAAVFLSNQLNELKKSGYNVNTWLKVPFKLDPKGMVLEIDTDLGKKRFMLDTGLTVTLLRSSNVQNHNELEQHFGMPIFPTSKFIIEGKDFGKMNLHLREITPELDILDGILGMDFFSKHQIYLDFHKKMAYIN